MKIRQVLVVSVSVLLIGHRSSATDMDYQTTLMSVAHDIASLKPSFPQLKEFSIRNANAKELRISYQFHTHKPEPGAGWTAGVPNPDDDGIWFFIDFHERSSTAQIHTQPAMTQPGECIGDKAVSFLSLEGASTKKLAGPIWKILRQHGVRKCSQKAD